jgi:hypothetical protein
MLGDNANAKLNRHSTFENEKGGHCVDLEACSQCGMVRNVHLHYSQMHCEGFLLIGRALHPSPETTAPEN